MAFNINRFKGALQDMAEDTEKNGVGQGLLSDVSRQQSLIPDNEKVCYKKIELDKIKLNPRNEYSQDQEKIENLAQSIAAVGQLEPVTVLEYNQEGFEYILVSGESRYRAIKMLNEKHMHSSYIDAYVKTLDEINLPLSDDLKEELLIVAPNAERRINNEYDKMMEVEKLNRIYTALREAGYQEVFGHRIANVKNRALVAETLGVSEGQVHKYQTVNKKGSDMLHNRMKEADGMSIHLASQIAEMDEEDQEEFLQITENKITPEMLDEFKERKVKVKSDKKEKKPDNLYTISDWKLQTKAISKILKEGVCLDPEKRKNLDKAIDTIREIFNL